jgi:hypothetical protein
LVCVLAAGVSCPQGYAIVGLRWRRSGCFPLANGKTNLTWDQGIDAGAPCAVRDQTKEV